MSFYSDWMAATDGGLDPVSGKPAVIHGKDVSPVHGGDEHQMKAGNDPRLPAVNVAAVPSSSPAPKKRNRWGGGGDE